MFDFSMIKGLCLWEFPSTQPYDFVMLCSRRLLNHDLLDRTVAHLHDVESLGKLSVANTIYVVDSFSFG